MTDTATATPSGRELLRDEAEKRGYGVHPAITLLLVLASFIAFGGLMTLTQATQGVGTLAFACFLGILGRILQAGSHHRQLMKRH